jgi:MFS family permease
VSLKLLPFGIAGLTLFAVDLYFALSAVDLGVVANTTHFGIRELFQFNGILRVFIDLFLLGFFGGIYIVPLYAFMQAYAPESHRARVVGANNIFNALYMVSSAVFAIVCLAVIKMTLPMLFAVVGVLNVLVGIWVFTKLKKHSKDAVMVEH